MPVLKLLFTWLFKRRYSAASNVCAALYIWLWMSVEQFGKPTAYFIVLFVIFVVALCAVSIIEDKFK